MLAKAQKNDVNKVRCTSSLSHGIYTPGDLLPLMPLLLTGVVFGGIARSTFSAESRAVAQAASAAQACQLLLRDAE